MMKMYSGDNLETLHRLKERGDKFDLVELDGPYMAGLEDWDNMTEAEYVAHYASRLSLVRDVLQPWGVVFVFGYPEGCAEIKSWARRTETLCLRRWLHWYIQRSPHEGRKIQVVLFFTKSGDRIIEFGNYLKRERLDRGWSLRELGKRAGKEWWHRGGNFYFETGRNYPSAPDMEVLKRLFGFNGQWDDITNYSGLTTRDLIQDYYPEPSETLNEESGLKSKPIGLYLDLFRPTIPPTEEKTALILYGGSGNAGIAAASLGYDVTICEQSPERCQAIKERWPRDVAKWTQRANNVQKALPLAMPEQAVLI